MSKRSSRKERRENRVERTALNLSVLNVGAGDLKVSFDKGNETERNRAAKIVGDLLKKGFAIMVEVGKNEKGPIFQRVSKFDAGTSEYIVFGDAIEESEIASPPVDVVATKKRGRPVTRVPSSTRAVAVARSAGGYDPIVPRMIRRGLSLRNVGEQV